MNIDFDTLLASIDGEVSPVQKKEESSDLVLTDHERDLIEMYRELDTIGQHTVDVVAKVEHERAINEKK